MAGTMGWVSVEFEKNKRSCFSIAWNISTGTKGGDGSNLISFI